MPMAPLGIKYINPIRKMPKMASGAAFKADSNAPSAPAMPV
jgi:hypothetical protein